MAITEHSCFHSEFGPFDTVMATAGSEVSTATPNIDTVHTEFRIGLTGEYSVVTYTPARTGMWAVLQGKDVPLEVLGGKAEALPSILHQNGTTGCAALPVLHVFELSKAVKYRLVFGPTAERTLVAVVEYIDDFLTQNGRDADGDGFGSADEVVVTPCQPPPGFAPNTRDCNDLDPLINPSAEELCDGVDQNCNNVADDIGLACRSGNGVCRAEGTTVCAADSGMAACSATPAEPGEETCNGRDDDCNGKIDDAESLCSDPDRPSCVRSGMSAACGCQLDLDCGAVESGRICDKASGVCEDGCSDEPGRNGCAVGEVCRKDTKTCEPGNHAGAPSDSSFGAMGSSDSPEPGAGTSEGGKTSSSRSEQGRNKEESGCGCRVAGNSGASNAAGALMFGLALGCLSVRRRRRTAAYLAGAALVVSSLVGCGGRVQEAFSSTGGDASGNDVVAGSSSSGGASGGTSAGAASDASSDCMHALGIEPIAHACTHTINGPFVPVVTGGDIPAPDVGDLHRTYEVQVVGSGAHLRYRAQRDGSHAFMTDAAVKFEVLRDGQKLSTLPSFSVIGCNHLAHAVVSELRPKVEYELAILDSPPAFDLFVEHLGAFGAGAWATACSEQ